MRKCLNVRKLLAMLFISLYSMSVNAADHWKLNMHEGVTPLSHDMYYIHMVTLGVCSLIGLGVFGVLIYSLIKYRKSKGAVAAKFHANLKVELTWTIIPFLILVILAIPATLVMMRMENTEDSDVTIKVIGHQWKWQYQYLNEGISYYSNLSTPRSQIDNSETKGKWYLLEVDKPLVLPINRKVRFLVTSDDVIHSWWVPELGVKRDAIPGFVHEAWAQIEKPGTYRGQCAELCGIFHGFMPIVVKAVSEKDYEAWVAKTDKVEAEPELVTNLSASDLMALGKKVYDTNCVACHQANGSGIPPMFPPLKSSSVAVGRPIARHVSLVLNGVPGTAMQAFANQLNDKEMAAVITYERNAWGNNTGDIVQPKFVASVRAGETPKE